MLHHPTQARPAVCLSHVQWQSLINRNQAVAKVSDLGGAIQIYRGRYFWPLQPKHPGNHIDIETIAHTLASIPRWGGQTADKNGDPLQYSVAQHSVHVADICALNRQKLVPKWDWSLSGSPALLGLLHDSPEGYGFCDLTRPVKYSFDGYKEGENVLMDHIIDVMNVPVDQAIRECVRRVDDLMIFLERDELMGPPVVPYSNEFDHPHLSIHDLVPEFRVWSAKEAKLRFLERYQTIIETDGFYEPLEYLNRGYRL